jgi:hypothetical protein
MTIKQALKEKNRLTTEIKELYAIAQRSNSIEKGNPRRYNVSITLEKAGELSQQLVDLKVRIHTANVGVFNKIFKLSELKNTVAQIKSISTDEGKVTEGYRTIESFKEVEMDEITKKKLVKTLETQINILQDELDIHNITTTIPD